MNTKEKILDKALEMFNLEGVEKVTTRHIAKALGMSQGNLHYHYPNKNELINTLFQEFLLAIHDAKSHSPEHEFSRLQVFSSMKENFNIMYTYRFLFIDNEIVWRRIPDIKTTVIKLFEVKKNEIKVLINQYQNEKIFRKEITNNQIDFLTNQFILVISTWLTASDYMNRPKSEVDYFVKFTFRLWLPYLTEQEMKAWEDIL